MAGPRTIYDFEWDPRKARGNLTKHGPGFEEAVTVFHNLLPCRCMILSIAKWRTDG